MEFGLFLVFAAIYAVIFVVKSLGSKDADVKGTPVAPPKQIFWNEEVPKEVFPNIDLRNLEKSEYFMIGELDESKNHIKISSSPKHSGVPSPVEEKSAEQLSGADKIEKRISLRNSSEAKRAFIYSEILNRKY